MSVAFTNEESAGKRPVLTLLPVTARFSHPNLSLCNGLKASNSSFQDRAKRRRRNRGRRTATSAPALSAIPFSRRARDFFPKVRRHRFRSGTRIVRCRRRSQHGTFNRAWIDAGNISHFWRGQADPKRPAQISWVSPVPSRWSQGRRRRAVGSGTKSSRLSLSPEPLKTASAFGR